MQEQSVEQLYAKYFCMPDDIDSVYHRKSAVAQSKMAPKIRLPDNASDLEIRIRNAMKMDKLGELWIYRNEYSLQAMETVLMNLPEIQDVKLKKRVLHFFRLFAYDLNRKVKNDGEKVLNLVASFAIINNLANTHDYACRIRHVKDDETKRKLINDLISQAKLDIKAEKADAEQIQLICEAVVKNTYSLPRATHDILVKEFDANKIIQGGNYTGNFEETIEIQHAEATELQNKIEACGKIITDYEKTKQQNQKLALEKANLEQQNEELQKKLEKVSDYDDMRQTVINLQSENKRLEDLNIKLKDKNITWVARLIEIREKAKDVKASLFSRKVNKCKQRIDTLTSGLENELTR
ncbi:MAG: hypothetical protein MJ165_01665 [Alphaproteobacteria bacterium]|nr:hypothetical protein [Alphaproteobacteria bacterium]